MVPVLYEIERDQCFPQDLARTPPASRRRVPVMYALSDMKKLVTVIQKPPFRDTLTSGGLYHG